MQAAILGLALGLVQGGLALGHGGLVLGHGGLALGHGELTLWGTGSEGIGSETWMSGTGGIGSDCDQRCINSRVIASNDVSISESSKLVIKVNIFRIRGGGRGARGASEPQMIMLAEELA